MKKVMCAVVAGAAIALGSVLPGLAMTGPGGGPGMGVHPGFGARPAVRGPQGFGGHPAFRGHHELRDHRDFRGHRDSRSRIVIVNPGFWWDPAYPDYPDPPVIAAPAPPINIQPGAPPDQAGYWYYCQDPQGYYPYVTECPAGWAAVLPPPPTPPAQ